MIHWIIPLVDAGSSSGYMFDELMNCGVWWELFWDFYLPILHACPNARMTKEKRKHKINNLPIKFSPSQLNNKGHKQDVIVLLYKKVQNLVINKK